jgi:hypothetical protein
VKLSEYLAQEGNQHRREGQLPVACNAMYKTAENLNCYLTASQAIEHARAMLAKAQLILDNDIEDAVVHVWSRGKNKEKLYHGLNQARKGPPRRRGAGAGSTEAE